MTTGQFFSRAVVFYFLLSKCERGGRWEVSLAIHPSKISPARSSPSLLSPLSSHSLHGRSLSKKRAKLQLLLPRSLFLPPPAGTGCSPPLPSLPPSQPTTVRGILPFRSRNLRDEPHQDVYRNSRYSPHPALIPCRTPRPRDTDCALFTPSISRRRAPFPPAYGTWICSLQVTQALPRSPARRSPAASSLPSARGTLPPSPQPFSVQDNDGIDISTTPSLPSRLRGRQTTQDQRGIPPFLSPLPLQDLGSRCGIV